MTLPARNDGENGGSATDRVYWELRTRICLLDYPAGTLISENSLASEFEVSRPWIRGILQRLEFERLLTRQSGSGVVVTADDFKTIKDAFYLRIRLYEIIAEDTPRVRVSDKDRTAFKDLLTKLETVREQRDVRAYGIVHMEFHEQFMSFVQNSFLHQFVNQLYYYTMRTWMRLLADMSWEEEVDSLAAEMQQTFEALQGGNMAEAAVARRDHLSTYVARLMDYLSGAIVGDRKKVEQSGSES